MPGVCTTDGTSWQARGYPAIHCSSLHIGLLSDRISFQQILLDCWAVHNRDRVGHDPVDTSHIRRGDDEHSVPEDPGHCALFLRASWNPEHLPDRKHDQMGPPGLDK